MYYALQCMCRSIALFPKLVSNMDFSPYPHAVATGEEKLTGVFTKICKGQVKFSTTTW